MKVFLSLTVVIFLFISCMDKIDIRNITINNISDNDIIYSLSLTDTVFDIEASRIVNYEINGKDVFKIDISHSYIDTLNKRERNIIRERPHHWKTYYDPYNRGNKMRLFIIKKDSVDKYGWEGIYKYNIYNKKYLLDIDDLDSLNWTIEYNGN